MHRAFPLLSCLLYIFRCRRVKKNTYAGPFDPPSIALKLMIFPLLFLQEQSSIFLQVSARIPGNSNTKRIQITRKGIAVLVCFLPIIRPRLFSKQHRRISVFVPWSSGWHSIRNKSFHGFLVCQVTYQISLARFHFALCVHPYSRTHSFLPLRSRRGESRFADAVSYEEVSNFVEDSPDIWRVAT